MTRRCGGDDVDAEFALDPLADDVEMEKTEEPAAETEAQRRRGLHFEGEARIVEPELAMRITQVLEPRRIDGKEAGEDDRLGRLEARQRRRRRPGSSVTVSPTRVSATCLMAAVKKPISPGPRLCRHLPLGTRNADTLDLVGGAGGHELDPLPLRISPSTMRTSTTTPR